MSYSTPELPHVAKLCSNCQKAQFRDDIPHLSQVGSHLEFDQDQLPLSKRFECKGWDFVKWMVIPTEFELVDSFPALPRLLKSCQERCDFCCFLHEAIISEASMRQAMSSISDRRRVIIVTISYIWRVLRKEPPPSFKVGYRWPLGLCGMRIDIKVCDEISPELTCELECEVQSLSG